MAKLKRWFGSAILVAVSVIVFSPVQAVEYRYLEDFTSSLYNNDLLTTAWWDTTAGEMKLYPFTPGMIGNLHTAGQALDVIVEGDRAYLADNNGLKIIDVTDPAVPVLLGSAGTPGITTGVFVSGRYAFVADGDSGLTVIDVVDPALPVVVGRADTTGNAQGITVAGNYAYIAAANAAPDLQIFDITDPAHPALVGALSLTGSAFDVQIAGDYAYIAASSVGLHVVDIGDPSAPALAATYGAATQGYGLAIDGNELYLAAGTGGLHVLDISDPTSPLSITSLELADVARDVIVSGDRAYVAGGNAGLQVIDISQPSAPVLVDAYATVSYNYGAATDGQCVFLAVNSQGLQVFEAVSPAAPLVIANKTAFNYQIFSVAVSGNVLYLGTDQNIRYFDITDPAAPVYLGVGASGIYTAQDITIDGDYLYTVNGSTLEAFDIAALKPLWLGSSMAYGCTILDIEGDRAYAGGTAGLVVFDISDPSAIAVLYSDMSVYANRDIVVRGDLLYAMGENQGSNYFMILDVSDPAFPVQLSSIAANGANGTLAISGDYAYLAGSSTIQVFDISDPANPVAVRTETSRTPRGIAITGNRLYLSSSVYGLWAYDISNPANMTEIDYYPLDLNIGPMAVSGDNAYVSYTPAAPGGDYGFYVLALTSRYFRSEKRIAHSTDVNPAAGASVAQVRLNAVYSGDIQWEYQTIDPFRYLVEWNPLLPDNNWHSVGEGYFLWRATLALSPFLPADGPVCESMDLEFRFNYACIDSIVDVGNDQGGWVRVYFARSGYDHPAEHGINDYVLWRRVDDAAFLQAAAQEGRRITRGTVHPLRAPDGDSGTSNGEAIYPDAPPQSLLEALPLIEWQGRYLFDPEIAPAAAALDLPPGVWEIVTSFPAMQQEQYIVLSPTLGDSTGSGVLSTAFCLSSHYGGSIFVSPPDSGYSIDNIAPGAPLNLSVAYNTGIGNQLSWDASPEVDFSYYRIYRSADPNFMPGLETLIRSTAIASWSDTVSAGYQYHYKITALDYAGNESDPAAASLLTAAEEISAPLQFALHQNVPNPFNPVTAIQYDVPASGGRVTLKIYDVSGRLVRTLVDAEETPGTKRIIWHGRDEGGSAVASGMYFCRLSAPGHVSTRKMVLLQ